MLVDPMPNIITVDCHYAAPQRAAAYLLLEEGRAAFVDNNTARALPHLLDALAKAGRRPEDVEYVIITHVHLDHAGGTAALLEACPNATVLAHPKAARHLIDPARLIAGATAVYGAAAFAELYGEIKPVPAERVRSIADNETLQWASCELRFLHTLGHATHHMCILAPRDQTIFTGDAFGLGLNESVRPGPPFYVATSAPPDFDPDEARKTVHRILATGAQYACLPHFGIHTNLARAGETLLRFLDQLTAILDDAVHQPDETLDAFCRNRVREATEAHLRWCDVSDVDFDLAWLGTDIEINAMGLAHAARRRR